MTAGAATRGLAPRAPADRARSADTAAATSLPPNVAPLDAENLRARVHKHLDAFLTQQCELLDRVSPDLVPLTDALGDLLAGGKRLRPAFCYWGWRGAGGADCEDALIAAASLELLQGCALIHDDVMDASDTRRGMPAAHRRFGTLHRGAEWHGSSESFGVGAAILLGDLCLVWADELLMSCGLSLESLQRGKVVYDEMRTELMAGQYLDLLEQARGGGSVERAMLVVRYKSAKYTIERPLHLGAELAGAGAELVAVYSGYGLPLGEAFQLRDDVLGVFGNPKQTGKPAGDDLREGKRTVLIATAAERATATQAGALRRYLGDPALSSHGIEVLREVIHDTGALAAAETLIGELTEQSLSALAGADVAEPARTVLVGLAEAATARTL